GDSIRNITYVLLSRPKGNVHDQAAMLTDHHSGRVSAGDVVSTHAGSKHCIPAPGWLLPKWQGPGKLTILDHPFVATPDVIHQNVETIRGFSDLFEESLHLLIVSVVTSVCNDTFMSLKRGLCDSAPSRVDEDTIRR